jgi:hypothetical protein
MFEDVFQDLPVILYIASASRSGSTVLDQTLGSLPGAISVGELRRLSDFVLRNMPVDPISEPDCGLICTCGLPLYRCKFWVEVANSIDFLFSEVSFSSQAGPWSRWSLQATFFVSSWRGVRLLSKIIPAFARELKVAKNCLAVYRAISKTYPDTTIIVDSSKLIYHFILLKTIAPHKVKLVQLVRDGRAVAKSMIKGQRMGSPTGESTALFSKALGMWQRSNLIMIILASRVPKADRYLLRYEDFCINYIQKIKDMLSKLIPTMGVDQFNFVSKKYHNIGGSPSRFHFKPSHIKLDNTWKQTMTKDDYRQFARRGRWINKHLGYTE